VCLRYVSAAQTARLNFPDEEPESIVSSNEVVVPSTSSSSSASLSVSDAEDSQPAAKRLAVCI
jgi:hypothetical protein